MSPKLGATGDYPDGKMSDDDEGGLRMALAADRENKVVVLNFGKSIAWIGLPKQTALALGQGIIEKAKELPD